MAGEGSDVSRVARSRDQARRSYDRLSRWYDLLSEPSEGPLREAGLRALRVREGEAVLEIGFGTGHGLVALARAVGASGSVHGIDLSPAVLRLARKRVDEAGLTNRVHLQPGDAMDLPYQDGSFDAVFMSFALELFDTPEIPVVLHQCRRVLRTRGRIGVVSMSKMQPTRPVARLYEWAHRRFPGLLDCRPILVRKSLKDAGFRIVKAEDRSTWGLPVEIVVGEKWERARDKE